MNIIVDSVVIDFSVALTHFLLLILILIVDVTSHAVAPVERVEVVRQRAEDQRPELPNVDIDLVTFVERSGLEVAPELPQCLHFLHLECRKAATY